MPKSKPEMPGVPPTLSTGLTPAYLDVKSAAAYLCCKVCQVRYLIWSRSIPFAKLGKKYILKREDLDRYVASITQDAA